MQPKLELIIYPIDTTINPNTSVQVRSKHNFLPKSVMWSPKDAGVLCDTCLITVITPLNTQKYKIDSSDSLGCTVLAEINIRVRPTPIYVPNAFTPNDDRENDFFTLYGNPTLAKIKSLQIYDRWGEKVFVTQNIDFNAESLGWNGIFRGKVATNDVYVYFAIIEYSNKEIELLKGDVMLIR